MAERLREFMDKKKWRHLKKSDWVVVALIGVLLLVIAMPSDNTSLQENKDKKNTNDLMQEKETAEDEQTIKEMQIKDVSEDSEYVRELEQQLKNILSQMEGVGKVEVMITVSDMGESVIEKDSENTSTVTSENDSAGGSRTVTEKNQKEQTIYVETGEETYPYVQKKKLPTIEGVVVVAEGGGSSAVVSDISEAVKALLPIEAHRIKVVKMCSKEE